MKKYLLLLFLSLKLVAQEMPISESNYFVYDKYSIGSEINNVTLSLHETSSGEMVVSEYAGYIYKINNTTAKKALPELKDKNPILIKYFNMGNGLEYYCTSQEIISTQNSKIKQRVKLNSQNDHCISFQKKGKIIYFITYSFDKTYLLRQFDGKNTTTLFKIDKNALRYDMRLFIADKIIVVDYIGTTLIFYELKRKKLVKIKSYAIENNPFAITEFKDVNNFSGTNNNVILVCKNGVFKKYKEPIFNMYASNYISIYVTDNEKEKEFYQLENDSVKKEFSTSFASKTFVSSYNKASNSFYSATSTKFLRFFPHIKKYPRISNNSNSNSVFILVQHQNGGIWAGSYQGSLSVIDKNKITESNIKDIMFMNGGLPYKDKMLLFAESEKGALLFSNKDNFKKIADNATFFYAYPSKDSILYLGSSGKGLWSTPIKNLESNKPINWKIIDQKNGIDLYNITSICEDKFGNIWMGRATQGISVYNPITDKAKTWLIDEKQIDFGAMAICKDTKNTLWFGTSKGELVYYAGKYKTDYDVKNFHSIKHPLFSNGEEFTFIQQWSDFLILGASDKILLFDLKKWHATQKVIVRYLNPMELNLTGGTEQNTILTDKRDQSIWFASNDMVYQWDIKKWLTLPTFKVVPTIIVKKDSIQTAFSRNKTIHFKPTENSFDIEINYQTKDNMPRFLNGVLVKKGEKVSWEHPNLETKFQFKNLSAGDYVFYIRVCQQDGSFDVFEYPICIDNFLWQKWWFWLLLSIPFFGIVFYIFQKKNQIEKQKKKLSQLNLSSLSNQFRPHFMLNALNSIGSQMQGKPHAEKVISRLGESINILYGFTQKNEFTLPFKNEWKLVENSIEIQRLLFLPDLKFTVTNENLIPNDYKIPVGLLQIPVENALLHGLRNKIDGNCILEIDFKEDENHYFITITDNGVGREKAMKINNFKKNGNGLKTIFEMITIINQHQKNSVVFEIIDQQAPTGTIVKIALNKNIDYEKIKI